MRLLTALIVWITAGAACVGLAYCVYAALVMNMHNAAYIDLVVIFGIYPLEAALYTFLVMPLFFGIFRMAISMTRGEKTDISDMFVAFSNGKTYGKYLYLSFGEVWRFGIAVLCFRMFGDSLIIIPIIIILAVLFFLLGYWFGLSAVLLSDGELTVRAAIKTVKRANSHGMWKRFKFKMSFGLWIMLSLCTVGVLMILHVAPYMMISYVTYTDKINENTKTDIISAENEVIYHE